MTYAEFINLPRIEHDEFISKLIQCVNKNEYCFLSAQMLVEASQENGMFSKMKFGNEILTETEQDLLTQQLSEI